jgi:hypothetical protein
MVVSPSDSVFSLEGAVVSWVAAVLVAVAAAVVVSSGSFWGLSPQDTRKAASMAMTKQKDAILAGFIGLSPRIINFGTWCQLDYTIYSL